ncbi:LysE family translocator [Paramicrobacterium agarici]|uniref:Threonine/homoserine/homoserine lactone efflux protein n=1 Tax=Paramicrobacterium agarici TaxID=630514 RepID=A0A2A9E0H6_9MICO|nr:LysE family translocator [Microbacterium agarici]PFG31722.1 threonine/homoserine/homoserine lactone efflux protein [Microbacterium agarici]TQO21626.1 threonine/homoserine/homoserine lactone efflux protein [Microbacterium agarici]
MLVSWTAILGVALIELGMVLTPGPNMIYLVSRSISQGTRAAMIALAGTAVGFFAYLAAAALGLATLFAAVPAAFVVVKIAGAIYLAYLAWHMLKPGGRSAFDPVAIAPVRPLRLFGMGLITNLLNPKIAVLYAALLPQFINPAQTIWVQFLILGGVQIVIGVVVNGLIAASAGRLSRFLRTRPVAMRLQGWLSGTLLAGFAVKLAFEKQPAQ